ncbi:MAG: 6-phospho-beta-glucosidase [Mycoplasmatales bacterium]
MIKVVTIGGGSSYTPELIEGFINRYDRFPIDELWLVDTQGGEEKLDIVGKLAQRMFEKANLKTKVFMTLNRREALPNATFVTTQFRVGQLEARKWDERIPNSHGMLGQETNGAGGMFNAFRTIPVIFDVIKEVEELCPDAFIINFANPSGIVSEAVNRYTNFKKFIGVCNVPIHLQFDLSEKFGVNLEEISIDFVGLNHMVFGTKVEVDGINVTSEAIEKIISNSMTMKNIHDIPFNPEFMRSLGLILCPYHRYWYKNKEMLEQQFKDFEGNNTRAEEVMKYEETLFEKYKDLSLDTKPEELELRGGAHYSDVACDVICSIYADEGKIHTVNIKNNGQVKNIDADDTIEITCRLTKDGAIPLDHITLIPREVKGIYELFKSYEIKVCEAAIEGSYEKAVLAMNLNPFTKSDDLNMVVLDELFEKNKQYIPWYK